MDLWLFKINNCNVKILTQRKLGFSVVQYHQTTEQLLFSGCDVSIDPPHSSIKNRFSFMTHPTCSQILPVDRH